MSLTCKATSSTSLASPQVFSAEDVSVNVTAPTDVGIGEEFSTTYSIDTVSVAVPSLPMSARLESASRLKLDFALPEGVTFTGAEIDESDANLKGFRVPQVNEAGNVDPNGCILRLNSADNATIGNGPNSSKNSHGGIRYDITGSHIDLRFPVIQLKLRADTEGEKNFGVRTAGAAGNFGADENSLTMNAQTSSIDFIGRGWAPTQCSPRPSETAPIGPRATQLATVKVNPKPAAADTSLELGEVTEAFAGTPVPLTAAVAPADAPGTVTFSSGEHSTGPVEVVFHQGDAEVGRATVVDGVAATTVSVPDEKATPTFRTVASDMETDTQELTGAEATTDVDVAPVSRTSIYVELEDDGVLVGRRTTITAKYSATPSIPEGTEVIFRADGIRIGTATVGSDGVATIEHSFDAAGPKRITALAEKREVDGRVYPRAESEAAVLTVDAGDSTIEEGATVSFFDGSTFLGTAPVDPATGQAVFNHRFAERGEHQIRITEVLEPYESDPVTLDVREHDVVIEEPGDNPGDNPGDGSGSCGASGSSSGGFLASVIGFLGNLGIIGTFLMSIFGLHAI